MIYSFSLQAVSLVLGIIYILTHGFGLFQPAAMRKMLKDFPRNARIGQGLLILAAGWFGWILATSDLMDYTKFRTLFLIGLAISTFLILKYLQELLSARAMGSLLILAAGVLLDSAFMQPHSARLVLVVLAYIYIIIGMIWVASPYLMRDMISFLIQDDFRYKIAAGAGCLFGFTLVLLAFVCF
ncbi:MAG: hypothetical protein AAF984_04695 [Verrucomicrobiota bacterium]